MIEGAKVVPAPPCCGRRLLSHLIDERARNGHARPYACIPRTTNAADGFRDVSYAQFANAINRLASWMSVHLGPPTRSCETVVYLGPSDFRYQLITLAAVKVGYVMFFPSPRNSQEAFNSLLRECAASKLLTTSRPPASVSLIEKSRRMERHTIPSSEDLLDPALVPHIPLPVTWEDYRFRPFVQIHTSGSTGIPKLMTLKHGCFSGVDAMQLLSINELGQRLGNLRTCVGFPPFHVAGLLYGMAIPCWVDSTLILPPAVALNAEVMNTVHVQCQAEFTLLAPSLVVDIAKNEEYLKNLMKLKGVTFAGGPLPEGTGSLIARQTKLMAGYGATEWQAVPQLPKLPEDWPYFHFNAKEGGMDFQERDEGLFEMVIRRKEGADLWQPVFVMFPELNEFASKDLFSKHPSKPGLWKYVSRLDDIIVFSNGEKINPVSFESLVNTSPDVKGCLVVGQGRFQAALIVEPADPSAGDIIDKIWPFIKRANDAAVHHGRILRDYIIVTPADKSFPRAGKGTIQRAAANKLYESEIEELYVTSGSRQSGTKIDLRNIEATKQSIASFLSDTIGLGDLKEREDFFDFGMDSLQLINLVRAINMARPSDPIDAKQVYDHPSVGSLAQLLHKDKATSYNGYDSDDDEQREAWLAMDDMFKRLTSDRNEKSSGWQRKMGWLSSNSGEPVIPPDGGVIAGLQLLSCFLININNWGLVNSFGIFQAYYESTILSSYSPSAVSWIGTVQGSLLLVVGVISGPLFDKGYFKSITTIASVGLVISLFMLSLSMKYYQVILAQGVLGGLCSGFLYVPSVALVPIYFKRRRGLALGVATGGGSVGGILYPIIFNALLTRIGFPWAVRVMGFIAMATLGTAVLIARPLGRRSRRQLVDVKALRELSYVSFMAAAVFLFAAMLVPFFLAASYSEQTLGVSTSLSFYTVTILNAGQLLGRLLPAIWADWHHYHLGSEVLLVVAEALCGVLGFAWIGVRNFGGFVPWLLIYGFASGMAATLPALVLPHISPSIAVYGTRLGMVYACAGLGFLVSTPIASAINSSAVGYLGSQVWTGACCVTACAFASITAREARRRRLAYEMGKKGGRLNWKIRNQKITAEKTATTV